MVLGVSDPDWASPHGPDRLLELEPAHLAAFRAFTRPQTDAERRLVAEDLGANRLEPGLNPALARRVYSGSEGRIYLVPGPGRVCCVAISTSGETMRGTTLTALASRDPIGYAGGGPGPEVTFKGVLPAGGRDLRVLQRSKHSVAVPLSDDDSYWVTVEDPIALFWMHADGTERSSRLFTQLDGPGGFSAHFG
jgi:hypothetical protein